MRIWNMPPKTSLGIFPAGRDEPFGVGLVRGNRFFDHHMQAGFKRRDAEGGVLKMRRGDDDGINRV